MSVRGIPVPAMTSLDRQSTLQELDLGVIVTSQLKVEAQCLAAERNSQKILGNVKRLLKHRNESMVLALLQISG